MLTVQGSGNQRRSATVFENPGGVLSRTEEARLTEVASQERSRRDLVIVLLALKAGLDAREQCALDVGHVTIAGGAESSFVLVPGRRLLFAPGLPAGAVPLPPCLRDELRAHVAALGGRCQHEKGRFGIDRRADGVTVCHVCRQPLEVARMPLLLSRLGERLSERQVHKLFGQLRARAGLPQACTFGTLVRTYEVRLRELLAAAVQAQG
jgi:hypothetical protein